jgi:hypothetical protein
VLWATYTTLPTSKAEMVVSNDGSFGIYDGNNGTCYWTSRSYIAWNQYRKAPFRLLSPSGIYELKLETDGNLQINDLSAAPTLTVWETGVHSITNDTMYLRMEVSHFCLILILQPLFVRLHNQTLVALLVRIVISSTTSMLLLQ